jgi:competence protein ComEC
VFLYHFLGISLELFRRYFIRASQNTSMKKGVVIFWCFLIVLACVRLGFSINVRRPDIGACLKNAVNGIGTVSEDPSRNESGQILVINVKRIGVDDQVCAENIFIRVKAKLYPRFTFGDQVNFSGKLSSPFNFKNDDGRSFDFKGYLAKDDIFYEIKSASVAAIGDLEASADSIGKLSWLPDNIISILYKIKRKFVTNLERSLGEPSAALAAGLVVGEKSALGAQLLQDFRTVGLIHIVVLSGFNITIVADALRRMLSRLPMVWSIVIGGAGMLLFGILVGGGATVVRSCLMASLALFADLTRRDYNVIRALSFAALIMLIQNPDILLHDPSFQLSFLATLGLILLASPIEKHLRIIPDKFGMRGTVAATLSTQIFVSPFILYTMGQISIIGVIVNILVLPFIPLTMLAVFLTGAFGFISLTFSQAIGWVAHLFLSYEIFMVESFASVPFASLHLPQFSGWFVVVFYVLFGFVYWWVGFGRRRFYKDNILTK